MPEQIAPGVKQYGAQKYKFGFGDAGAAAIADAVGLTPQTLDVSSEPEFTAEAQNLYGLTEAFVQSDDKRTFTMSGFITNATLFETPGGTFTYKNKFFIVGSKKETTSNKDFTKGEISGVSFPLITE
jgi:hypothetical protein